MIVTKKAMSRRTMLRGVGTAFALPVLDSMVPALTALAQTAATPPARLGIVHIGLGVIMEQFTPRGDGASIQISPILKPLAPFVDHLTVVSGLDNRPGIALQGEPAGGHGRVAPAFLSGVHAKPTEGGDVRAGVTIDQIAAQHLGQRTQLASLELQTEASGFGGACDAGFSCTYMNTVCWRTPTTPLPMDNDPRAVFERLFGEGGTTDPAMRLANLRADRSILDSVTDQVARLKSRVSASDRTKVSEYLEAIRDIERRIQNAERQGTVELPVVSAPLGLPETYEQHVKLMFDLQVLAYQSDLTRVITFQMAREGSDRTYPELGITERHHTTSHHRGDPDKVAKIIKINVFHTQLLSYYLEKLKSTADGNGSLLDHMLLVYASGMGDANLHVPINVPLLLAGGIAGRREGGRHVRCDDHTPLANAWVNVLNKVGVPIERIGDSTGRISELL